jgi:hypothetical protein
VTIFAAKTDNAVESEFSEPNSLREVLLFCAVLVVEVYSLAVAFGGPFFEVGYFLLVVISQTTAGAYIWAQLRRADQSLPLPELLAMGFAIGSASAAISQLIIRDLLGIRLFLSPLVPIISVAIWLVAKRNTQLPVKVTHATTNTLLWLLFPAPLALMTYSMFLVPLFITPLLLAIYFAKRRQIFRIAPTIKLLMFTSLFFFLTSVIYRISSALTKSEIGIDPYADDIRFDVVQSIGFAKWGINTNVELINHPEAYYKLSHLWLAPITNFDSESLMNLSITVLPIFLILMTCLAFFAITLHLSDKHKAAGVAACLYFIQTDFSDNFGINLRSVWLLGGFYLISFGVFALRFLKPDLNNPNVFLFMAAFIVSGTRIFLAPFMISMVFLSRNRFLPTIKTFLFTNFLSVISICSGVATSLFIFSRGKDSTLYSSMKISSADWPVSMMASLSFAIQATMPRVGLLFVALFLLNRYRYLRLYVLVSSMIFVFLQFWTPRMSTYGTDALVPYVLALTPVFSIIIVDTFEGLHCNVRGRLIFGGLSVLIGFILKTLHDSVRDELYYDSIFKDLVTRLMSNEYLVNLVLLTSCLILTLLLTKPFVSASTKVIIPLLLCAVVLGNVGVKIGSLTRPITEYVRYNEAFFGGERDSLLVRWEDVNLWSGLKMVNSISSENDVIASNFGLQRATGFNDVIRPQIAISRSYFISGRYTYFATSFPLTFTEKYRNVSDYDIKRNEFARMLRERLNTSQDFPNFPSRDLLANMLKEDVKWFVVDLGNTQLRDWEPWATTRFMNEKVAILELAQLPAPSN